MLTFMYPSLVFCMLYLHICIRNNSTGFVGNEVIVILRVISRVFSRLILYTQMLTEQKLSSQRGEKLKQVKQKFTELKSKVTLKLLQQDSEKSTKNDAKN